MHWAESVVVMNGAIRRRAMELGFEDCRFTAADPPDHAAQFQSWLAEGRQGEMAYLQRNASRRVNPREVLPGAKSIVTIAASYHSAISTSRFRISNQSTASDPPPNSKPAPGVSRIKNHESHVRQQGVLARYARFKDYHEVLAAQLRDLGGFIDQLGGAGTQSLWYIDTGPLLERDLAQRAGLGFIGKHTNLISRRLGNWFFLGEILTTLELEPDSPEPNRCGSCTRCISACPTAAITAPFQLDARRCISYLTIELRGSIPLELRPLMGNRIFGCDDCLAACPWNRFAREGNLMKQHARSDLAGSDLIDLLALDEVGFKVRFAGTPILRAKRRGLLRNVCVALGNVGDASTVPALQKAASDPEPLIAEHATWAIDRIQTRLAIPPE